MIKIQNYDKEKQKIEFVTDMPLVLANAIRRTVLEIPIFAIDEIEIIKNDSALFDEILAHRMGLIPIKTSNVSGKELMFKIKKKGPCTVYSTDLEPDIGTKQKLPIVILDNKQELEINATAKLGKGIDHIKHSPGLIYYKHFLDTNLLDFVTIDENGKVSYDENELKEKNVPEEQIKKIKNLKSVNELIFSIESWGQIDVKEIFEKSIEVLDKNLKEFAKIVK